VVCFIVLPIVPHRMFFMVPASVCSRYLETYQYFGWLIISLIGRITRITRNPLLSLINEYLIDSPAPINLSYFWGFGSLLGVNLVILIVSGVTLAMHYADSTIILLMTPRCSLFGYICI
jgi:hypothetical protein